MDQGGDGKMLRIEPDDGTLLSLVVPVFNEKDVLTDFYHCICGALRSMPVDSEIIFVNDGSTDGTLAVIQALRKNDSRIMIVDLSRNFGKDVALSAGIDHARGDAVISIDADLQHPPEVIPKLFEKWQEGYDIVFAVRHTRKKEKWIKRVGSVFFYRTLGWLTHLPNHDRIGDFCLFDCRVIEVLRRIPERNRFMKGLFAWLGFRQGLISYEMEIRRAGKTKWSYWRLWNFAIEGITSFSSIPLKIWTYFGFAISLVCLLYASFIVIRTIVLGIDLPGYASLIVSVLFMGGIQLISLGIAGEYIGRIYTEVKGRPLYIVRDLYGLDGSRDQIKYDQDTKSQV